MYLLFREKNNEYCPGSTSLWMAFADSKRNWKQNYQVIIKLVLCLSLLVLGFCVITCARIGNKRCIIWCNLFLSGGGTGGSEPPTSRTLLSRFPYLYLPPPALYRVAPVPWFRSPCRLHFLQFDSLRNTCALMPLDILWPIWHNHCKQVYYFTRSKPVFKPKRKFSFAHLLVCSEVSMVTEKT